MQRTLSIRMDEDNYEFVKKMAKENKEEISKSVRELVDMGRLMYAVESYRKGKASIGKASEMAGISISEMMDRLSDFGVKSNLTKEDYLEGLKNLRKIW
ncbi:MAG: UPF0175 family protein [Candidatus Aenigmarchaeota archaeon]|nr:UPF0175 family protein [Candidatus Aenigmarchaeota archaeon]